METIITEGYTDYALNCTYPQDNYNGSILAFFEGNVPFYVCNAECVSGMKKRESKSETYSQNPFVYEFVYAPIGDEGAYAYSTVWYGFSVSKKSQNKEMALEFLRFLSEPKQLDAMASTKSMPSVIIDGVNERYSALLQADNLQSNLRNDGSIASNVRDIFIQVCNDFGAGLYKTADEAAHAFVQQCSQG